MFGNKEVITHTLDVKIFVVSIIPLAALWLWRMVLNSSMFANLYFCIQNY